MTAGQHPETTGSAPYRCGLCSGRPRWRLDRHGDAVVTWACSDHLILVLADFLPVDSHRDAAVITDLTNRWGVCGVAR